VQWYSTPYYDDHEHNLSRVWVARGPRENFACRRLERLRFVAATWARPRQQGPLGMSPPRSAREARAPRTAAALEFASTPRRPRIRRQGRCGRGQAAGRPTKRNLVKTGLAAVARFWI